MKYNELREADEFSKEVRKDLIDVWCRKYIPNVNCTVNEDFTIDAESTVDLITCGSLTKLPYKFRKIHGAFNAPPVSNFDNFPDECFKLDLRVAKITSLEGIHEIVKFNSDSAFATSISFLSDKIISGGLGLLLVEGLYKIYPILMNHLKSSEETDQNRAFKIIQKYINEYPEAERKALLYDCQNELLDAGLEAFAKL